MFRVICLGFLTVVVAAASANCEEPVAAADSEFVPGFDEKIAWSTVARIELVEGQESFKRFGANQPRQRPVSEVVLYRFRDNVQRPMARGADVFFPAGGSQDPPEERLEKRGKKWQELVSKHNPTIHLEAIHRDTTKVQQLMGPLNVKQNVKQQSTLNQPAAKVIDAARAEERAAIDAVLAEHQWKKDVATFWYFAGNALLGCATIAVLAFVILPAVRKEAPVAATAPQATATPDAKN